MPRFSVNWLAKLLLLLCGSFLLFHSTQRAIHCSVTHDEVNTYFNFVHIPVWHCFFSEKCWGDANNHLLNTFLIQQTTAIWGKSTFAIRIPALFSHLLYLFFSGLLILKLSNARPTAEKLVLVFAGYVLLNLNPYLIEFFSLARGYGVGMGFMMASLYFFLADDRPGWSFAMASLAVMSNFVYLNYFACLLAAYFLRWMIWNRNEKSALVWPAIFTIVLGILLYKPIGILRSGGEFDFGAASLAITFREIFEDSLMGESYFAKDTREIVQFWSLTLVGIATLLGLVKWKNKPYFMASILLLLNFAAMITQNWLLDIEFLVDRKSIMLIPFMVLPVWFFIREGMQGARFFRVPLLFALFISGLGISHFVRTHSHTYMREWYYDVQTKEMMETHFDSSASASHIGVHWRYRPSVTWYIQELELPISMSILHEGELSDYDKAGWLYIEHNQLKEVSKDYEIVEQYGYTAYLLFKPATAVSN